MATKDKSSDPLKFSVGDVVRVRSSAPGGYRNRNGTVVATLPHYVSFPYEVAVPGQVDTMMLSKDEVRQPTAEEINEDLWIPGGLDKCPPTWYTGSRSG